MKIDQKELLELGYQSMIKYPISYVASWSTVVEEGELVDTARTRATTSLIRVMTSGAGRSTLGGGV
ncbi:hypothetical protein Tco_0509892, partial [Tanacetum coccineum]